MKEFVFIPNFEDQAVETTLESMSSAFGTLSVSEAVNEAIPARNTSIKRNVLTAAMSLEATSNQDMKVLDIEKSSGAAHVAVANSDNKPMQSSVGSFYPVEYYELALVKQMRIGKRRVNITPMNSSQDYFTLKLVNSETGEPISNAKAKIILPNIDVDISAVSNESGLVVFPIQGSILLSPGLLIEAGFDNHWGYYNGFSRLESGDTIDINPIDLLHQKDSLRLMASGPAPGRGFGVKIGVIDSGVGPHINLPNASGDIDSSIGHGTHVAGIIAGKGPAELQGLAPDAEIISYRVFDDPSTQVTANFLIYKAIYQAVEDGCHLINMSLKIMTETQDPVVARAMDFAKSKGVICFAAAGNDFKRRVAFPARHTSCLAISACGNVDGLPGTAIDNWTVPTGDRSSLNSDVFLAKFSNIGKDGTTIDYMAPGAGIVATVPGDNYAPMSGTSMACPAAVGAAAQILSANPTVLTMPSDHNRHSQMMALINGAVQKNGFSPAYEGYGMIGYGH